MVVAHPGQLRLIFRSKRKNDRVDAEKLAKLLFFDEVLSFANELDTARRDMLYERLCFLTKMIERVEATLARVASRPILECNCCGPFRESDLVPPRP